MGEDNTIKTPEGNDLKVVEKKGWLKTQLEKRAEKKAEFAKNHPVAARRIDTLKKVGGGAIIGGLAVKATEAICDILGRGSDDSEYNIIDTGVIDNDNEQNESEN